MNNDNNDVLLVLDSGLFPDSGTLRQALGRMEGRQRVQYRDLTDPALAPDAWDRLLQEILGAGKVMTL